MTTTTQTRREAQPQVTLVLANEAVALVGAVRDAEARGNGSAEAQALAEVRDFVGREGGAGHRALAEACAALGYDVTFAVSDE